MAQIITPHKIADKFKGSYAVASIGAEVGALARSEPGTTVVCGGAA
jgi:hypothetical protein